MKYDNLEKILGKNWLNKNPNHPYNQWIIKPEKSKEKIVLSNLESYLKKIPLLKTKTIQTKLRNPTQFVDTYYELEVACYLIDNEFDVDLERNFLNKLGFDITPDIFLKTDNIIIEVKTLHRSDKVKEGLNSGKAFKHNEAIRIKDDIFSELEKYAGKGIKYPLIIIICPDFIEPPYVSIDDFENVLYARADKAVFIGEFCLTPNFEYKGVYYDGDQANILSGVGLWDKGRIIFFENPNVKKELTLLQIKLLNLLQKRVLDQKERN